jgi:hypothetical protein
MNRPILPLRFALCASVSGFALMFATPIAQLHGQGVVTVRGTVTNEAGRPLEYAQVTLDPQGATRQVRTDRDGRFSFLGVPQGTHAVRVTWVGFTPQNRAIDVGSSDVTVDIVLVRLTVLDTVAVTARRTGLYGSVISRDSLMPVPGARIEIIGARTADSTNSSGIFNLPELKPGTYIVRIRHSSFESRNFGVTVPVGGAAELDVVVDRGLVSRDQHLEMLYREMDSRLTFRGINTAFVTREELRGREALPFMPAVSKKSIFIASDLCLFVDGVARPGFNLSDFAPEDIESVEIYAAPARTTWAVGPSGMPETHSARTLQQADPTGSLRDRWPPRTPCGRPPLRSEAGQSTSSVKTIFAVVWLRK